MKKVISAMSLCLLMLTNCSVVQNLDMARLTEGGVKMVQSMTVTNNQMQQYVKSYIAESDNKNTVCGANDPYTKRLSTILSGITSVEGIPLNFKVYKTNDINAFACADGSIRVYSGLMDVMSDDEVLGVIGHEIGHVAHEDTKKSFRNALQTAALMDVIASTGSTAAALTDSQFGAIAQSLASAKYSQSQENNADDYGYAFLKANGKNPSAMVKAFQKLKQMEEAAGGTQTTGMKQLFSTHPDINKRISRMQAKCKKDGYSY